MKNTNKLMMILGAATLLASCGGANGAKTGEAYALCHGGSYVAGATVTVEGGKVTKATLGEVCLPSYITADETVDAEKKVTGTIVDHGTETEVSYYKEVKFGSYTLTATVKDGALSYEGADWSKAEVCSAYYKAVMANDVAACGDKTIMTKAALSKDENGYGGERFNWKSNRDATVAAYVEYGSEKCLAATQVEDEAGKKYWTIDGVSTGSTWTDFNKIADGYLSYIAVLTAAEANAK